MSPYSTAGIIVKVAWIIHKSQCSSSPRNEGLHFPETTYSTVYCTCSRQRTSLCDTCHCIRLACSCLRWQHHHKHADMFYCQPGASRTFDSWLLTEQSKEMFHVSGAHSALGLGNVTTHARDDGYFMFKWDKAVSVYLLSREESCSWGDWVSLALFAVFLLLFPLRAT